MAATALLIGLAYHIGRSQTRAWVEYYGIDLSFLELSTQEYAQRSLDTFFLVILAIVLLSSLTLIVDRQLEAIINRQSSPQLLRITIKALLILSGTALALGLVAIIVQIDAHSLALAAASGVGLALFAYRRHLRFKYARALGINPGTASPAYPYLMATAATLSIFWISNEFATTLGTYRAEYVASNLTIRPRVSVYSAESLAIDEPGVTETRIDTPNSAYNFRYEGMRLFTKSGDTLFLFSEEWTKNRGSIVILEKGQGIRFEIYNYTDGG